MVENYDKFFINDQLGIQSDVIGFAHLIKQEKYTKIKFEKGEEDTRPAKVYAISAEFGIGKTFFCDRLYDVLHKGDKVPAIKMNIWEMDFYEDPLIPILIKIRELYDEHHKIKQAVASVAKKTKNAVKTVAAMGVKGAIKKAIGFDFDEFIQTYSALDDKSDIYNKYQEYESELQKLKSVLKDWAHYEGKKGNPIVIIIDELDRCRPDYAVKTLEVLKHFFDIHGFVFVLALDEAQLQSSVKCLFGTENFDGYKRKFINNSFLIKTPDKEKFTKYLYYKTDLDSVIEEIQDNNKDLIFRIKDGDYRIQNQEERQARYDFNEWQISEEIIKRYFATYSIWFKFSLRQMEQVFDRLVLFTKEIYASGELFSPDLAVLLVCLHEFDTNIYNRLREHPGTIQRVLSKIYGDQQSLVSLAYTEDKKELSKRFGKFERRIVPQMPAIEHYSKIGNSQPLHDNVDRFFSTEKNPTGTPQWMVEVRDNNNRMHNNIDTHGVLAYIVTENDRYGETLKIYDTAKDFDLAKFKKFYFEKMDFISRFSDKPTEEQEPIYKTTATNAMQAWLKTLNPGISAKVDQIATGASRGIYHDAKPVADTKIYEQSVNSRKNVYYIRTEDKLVFLLGGEKSTREENIKQAKELSKEYETKDL